MSCQPLSVIYAKSIFKQTVLFQTIQFSSIWPINMTLSSATTPSQSGPGSDGNEGVLCISQSSSITGTSSSDCLESYLGHSGRGYPSAEKQSVNSTAPDDWARSWRWWTILDCEMPNLCDTLQVLITGFASMAWSTASESSFSPTQSCMIIKILAIESNFFHHLVTVP